MQWDDWLAIARANAAWIIAGVTGRMIFHGREVQAGRRRFWGWVLPFELLIAIGMAFLGKSAAEYFGLTMEHATAAAGIAAYLGPRAIDTLFDKFARRPA